MKYTFRNHISDNDLEEKYLSGKISDIVFEKIINDSKNYFIINNFVISLSDNEIQKKIEDLKVFNKNYFIMTAGINENEIKQYYNIWKSIIFDLPDLNNKTEICKKIIDFHKSNPDIDINKIPGLSETTRKFLIYGLIPETKIDKKILSESSFFKRSFKF